MRSRLRFGLLVCLLVLGASLLTPASADAFPDVTGSSDYPEAITALADRGVIRGFDDGTFRPETAVVRQQFAKMIVKTLGLTVSGDEYCWFYDVGTGMDLGDPFYPDKYVAVCSGFNITQGKTSTTFDPYAAISRAQVVTMVVRALESLRPGTLTAPPFDYTGTLGDFGLDHSANMAKAEYNGLLVGLQGFGSSWDPYKNASRGEVAQVLWCLWQKMGPPLEGRDIVIGLVTPLTGPLATYGVADRYCLERWREATGDGLLLGDGKEHRVIFIVKDSQSDPNRAAQVAAELNQNAKVDLMLVASEAETVNPVADQCEAQGVPCLSTDVVWQNYFYGRGGDPDIGFKWTYHYSWGMEDIADTHTAMWSRVPSSRVVGALWPNNVDGYVFAEYFPAAILDIGYTLVDPGRYPPGLEDFTSEIFNFKHEGVEIVSGVMSPSELRNFWLQSLQQGFSPQIATVSRALRFPEMLEWLWDIGIGLTTDVSWSPAFPFRSSLTGETCRDLADDFEARTGQQWTQALLHYGLGEMAIDVLERVQGPIGKESILKALKTTRLDTIAGPVDFTSPVAQGSLHPVPNVYKSPLAGGQWVEGTKWPYDLTIVDNTVAPAVPVQSEIRSLTAVHTHLLEILAVGQVGDEPACTFKVDDAIYKDQRVGDVISTSWGLIQVLEITIISKVVTLRHGSETLVLTVGSVVNE